MVTLGILYYDQRNTEIYDSYVERAKKIELLLNNNLRKGTFGSRAPRGRELFGYFSMWHDKGLALIYSSVFCIWFFIIFDSIKFVFICKNNYILDFSILLISIFLSLSIYVELLRLDDTRKEEDFKKKKEKKDSKIGYWQYLNFIFFKKSSETEKGTSKSLIDEL